MSVRGYDLPSRTRIKICCIASLEEADLAARNGADAIGLVGAMPSRPGVIDDIGIAAIASAVPPPIATFLLTAESSAQTIAAHVRRTGVSTIQIVSHLDPAESEKLVDLLPVTRRVQLIHVEDERALNLITRYARNAHAFLLDSGRPNLPVPEYGGSGRPHDWKVSAEFVRRSPLPVFLAGGLSASNVGDAIQLVRPFGVDLCSGVRTGGRLDPGKLQAFVNAVRQADAAHASA